MTTKAKFTGSIKPQSVAGDTIFSFETSGLEGGDGSYLEISIKAGAAMMNIAVNGAPMSAGASGGRAVTIRFMGDIELGVAAEGLEFLAHRVRQALTTESSDRE